jgi:hypothetical protein
VGLSARPDRMRADALKGDQHENDDQAQAQQAPVGRGIAQPQSQKRGLPPSTGARIARLPRVHGAGLVVVL